MPSGWLNAFAEMLPRLRDEEMLREIVVMSAGSGTMVEGHRRDLMRSLRHSPASGPKKQTLADLAAMGINVVVEGPGV